jgi:hypothetical protein
LSVYNNSYKKYRRGSSKNHAMNSFMLLRTLTEVSGTCTGYPLDEFFVAISCKMTFRETLRLCRKSESFSVINNLPPCLPQVLQPHIFTLGLFYKCDISTLITLTIQFVCSTEISAPHITVPRHIVPFFHPPVHINKNMRPERDNDLITKSINYCCETER